MDCIKASDLPPDGAQGDAKGAPKKAKEQTPFKILKGEEVCRGPAEPLHPKGVVVQVYVF